MSGQKIIDQAIIDYKPAAIFALFSGGHDSLVSTHFSASVLGDRLSGVVHIDTGIGIPETQEFVKETCQQQGWPLLIYRAVENTKADGTPDPKDYEQLVIENGFPGPGAHQYFYNNLKLRQVERLIRDHRHKRGERFMLLTGVRKEESNRRMGNVKAVQVQKGGQVWVAPMLDHTSQDQHDYMKAHELPRNPVKDKLCMSGECLCGAFAHKGELSELRYWYPDVAARIERLEQRVLEKYGKSNGWEGSDFGINDDRQGMLPLCVGCAQREAA
jgi:3'-phosphoadenosine 5'-phosphosulfate sulfotransferase (PAPS reductase)/FAD synthetase